MLDARLVIHMLLAVDHVETVQHRLGRIAGERRVHVRARKLRAGRERERLVAAVSRLMNLNRSNVKRVPAFALKLVVTEARTFGDEYLGHRVCEVARRRRRDDSSR